MKTFSTLLLLVLLISVSSAYPSSKYPWVTGTCPDGGTCPNDYTCCPINSEKYGCCKERNAVCCSDGVHCCPEGDTCDLRDGTCNRNGYKTSMMMETTTTKQIDLEVKPLLSNAATPPEVRSTSITCPDGGTCSSDQTCCPVGSGKYGCCQERNAVCCSDYRHCCPEGNTCDLSDGSCNQNSYKILMMKLLALPSVMETTAKKQLKVTPPLPNTIKRCPGSNIGCNTAYTCCRVTGQKADYMCCHYPNAVCCSPDSLYCCKSGQKCYGDAKCTDGNEVVSATWLDQVEEAAGII